MSGPAAARYAAWRPVLQAGAGTFVAFAAIGALAAASKTPLILGSFGATCVLLFGFPHGPFSQPRHILGGHLLTTVCGLLFLQLAGPGWVSLAAASACALMLMLATGTPASAGGEQPRHRFSRPRRLAVPAVPGRRRGAAAGADRAGMVADRDAAALAGARYDASENCSGNAASTARRCVTSASLVT